MASNDPRRRNHSGDPRKQGTDGSAAVPVPVPAFPGGQVPNGQPALTGQAARLAQAVESAMATMMQGLPGQVAEAFYQVVSRVPVQLKLNCAECLLARQQWNARHARELQAAFEQYQAAMNELAPEDPRRTMISPVSFLPPQLQPARAPENASPDAMPPIEAPDTMVGGTLVCAAHDPRVPAQASKRPFLIAQGFLTDELRSAAMSEALAPRR